MVVIRGRRQSRLRVLSTVSRLYIILPIYVYDRVYSEQSMYRNLAWWKGVC